MYKVTFSYVRGRYYRHQDMYRQKVLIHVILNEEESLCWNTDKLRVYCMDLVNYIEVINNSDNIVNILKN